MWPQIRTVPMRWARLPNLADAFEVGPAAEVAARGAVASLLVYADGSRRESRGGTTKAVLKEIPNEKRGLGRRDWARGQPAWEEGATAGRVSAATGDATLAGRCTESCVPGCLRSYAIFTPGTACRFRTRRQTRRQLLRHQCCPQRRVQTITHYVLKENYLYPIPFILTFFLKHCAEMSQPAKRIY